MSPSNLHHQRHINGLVRSSIEQVDFPTSVFLSRRAQKLHTPIDPESLHSVRKSDKPSHGSGGNEIVTARVADPGKCIVLCVEIDGPTAFPADHLESRLQTVRMPGDLVAQVI